jgi:hypothetical protein
VFETWNARWGRFERPLMRRTHRFVTYTRSVKFRLWDPSAHISPTLTAPKDALSLLKNLSSLGIGLPDMTMPDRLLDDLGREAVATIGHLEKFALPTAAQIRFKTPRL